MREECIILTGENNVTDPIPFKKNETIFLLETALIIPNFLSLSLGSRKKEGLTMALRADSIEKEFSINEYEWIIIKANFLKSTDALKIVLRIA